MEEKEIKYIKTNENLEEKSRIITKIKLNKCCLYLCFCYARKIKNIQNILINEGMKIISEKLDIINIFKKVYRIEKNNINNITEDEMFDMSEDYKNYLKDFNKPFYGL